MRAHHRLSVAAFCTDLALYLLMLSLPFRALDLGASSVVLGLVPLLYAGPYGLLALTAGRVSDRWPRRTPIRAGLAVAIAGSVGLAWVETLAPVLALVPLVGVGLGFFWPSVQAGFSEVYAGRELHRMVRLLNVSWSTGKGAGLLLGGLLLEALGARGVSLLAAGAFAAAAIAVPWMDRPGDHTAAIEEDERIPPAGRRLAFLHSAWVANASTFAVAATFNHHLPRVVRAHGLDAGDLGLFMGTIFFSQTLCFVSIGPMRWWHFRAGPLLAALASVIAGALVVGHLDSLWALLVLAPPLGLALGFAYQSSIYYSLHAPANRGRQAGVHESALGIASASIPLAGGALVASQGLLAPFAVAALTAGVALVLGIAWLSRARTD